MQTCQGPEMKSV